MLKIERLSFIIFSFQNQEWVYPLVCHRRQRGKGPRSRRVNICFVVSPFSSRPLCASYKNFRPHRNNQSKQYVSCRLASRRPFECLFIQTAAMTDGGAQGRRKLKKMRWNETRIWVGGGGGGRSTSQMVRMSYSQKLCFLQIWVKQYVKIILSICYNLPAVCKRLNETHRTKWDQDALGSLWGGL